MFRTNEVKAKKNAPLLQGVEGTIKIKGKIKKNSGKDIEKL